MGALQEEDGNYRFVLTEAFAGSKVSPGGGFLCPTGEHPGCLCQGPQAVRYGQGRGQDGEIAFTGLELGLYLLVQHKAAKGYETAAPFLVSACPCPWRKTAYSARRRRQPQGGTGKNRNPPLPHPCTHRPPVPYTGQLNWPVPVLTVLGLPACAGLGAAEEEPPWVRPGTWEG